MVLHREVSLQSLLTTTSDITLSRTHLLEARIPEHIRLHIRREEQDHNQQHQHHFSPGYGGASSSPLEFGGTHVISSHLFSDVINRRIDRSIVWRVQGDTLELREYAFDGNLQQSRQEDEEELSQDDVLLIRFPGRIIPNVCFVEPDNPNRDPTLYLFVVTSVRTVHRIAISTIFSRTFRTSAGIKSSNSLLAQLKMEFGSHHGCEYIETPTRKAPLQYAHALDENKIVIGLSSGKLIGLELLHRGKSEFELTHSSIIERLWSGLVSKPNTDTGVVGIRHVHRGDDTLLFTLSSDCRVRLWSLKEKGCTLTFDLDVNQEVLDAMAFNLDPLKIVEHSVDLFSLIIYLGNSKNTSTGQFHCLRAEFQENDIPSSCKINTETIKGAPTVKQNALTSFDVADGNIWALWSTVNSTYCVTRGPIIKTVGHTFATQPWSVVHTRYDDINTFPMDDYRTMNVELQELLLDRMTHTNSFTSKVIQEVIERRGAFSGEHSAQNLTTEALKTHLRNIIDTHVHNIADPLFVVDSHANDNVEQAMARATFDTFRKLWQQCLKQWLVNYLPVGIGTVTKDSCICLISMNGISIVRPCDPIEALYCPNKHTGLAYTTASSSQSDFANLLLDDIVVLRDQQARQDVINLVECVRYTADETGEGLLASFENSLSMAEDPVASVQPIISYLLGSTAARTSSPLRPQRHSFMLQLTRLFRKVRNPQQAIDYLLKSLDFDPYTMAMQRQQFLQEQQGPIDDRSQLTNMVNCRSRNISSLVSNTCIQMIGARFRFSRDFALFLFLLVQLRPHIGMDMMLRAQLETHFVTKMTLVLKMYGVLYWMSNQILLPSQHASRYDISDDMSQMRISSPAVHQQFFTPLRRAGSLIEFLYNEPLFITRNEHRLRDFAVFSRSRTNTIIFLSLQTVQQLWCVYEEQQARAIEIALALYRTQQMETLEHFSQLLIQDIPHLHHFLGMYHLHRGTINKAKKCFIFAAMSIADLDTTKRTTHTELLFSMFEWNPFNRITEENETQRDALNQAILFYYYQCLCKYCEKYFHQHNEFVLHFSRLALDEIALYPLMENEEEVAILWSIVFTYSLKLEKYDMAYVAITSNPDKERQKTDMRRFVNVLVERGELVFLNELPFVGLVADVEAILQQKASTGDILLQQPLSYYEILYSFHIYRANYCKAAAVMYDFGVRLGRESQSRENGPGNSSLQRQEAAYSAALHTLRVMDVKDRWFVVPATPADDSNAQIANGNNPGQFSQITTPALLQTPKLVTDQDVAKELLMVQALLELSNSEKPKQQREKTYRSPALTPEDAISLLLEAQLYDKAITICDQFKLSKIPVFESMASYYATSLRSGADTQSAEQIWSMIEMALARFVNNDGKQQQSVDDSNHVAVLRKILDVDRRAEPPASLFSFLRCHNPSALLRILLDHELVFDAANLAEAVLSDVGDRDATTTQSPSSSISLIQLENVISRLMEMSTRNTTSDVDRQSLGNKVQSLEDLISTFVDRSACNK